MKALILKDIYNLSKTAKMTLFILVAYGIFGLVSGQISFLTSMMAVFCSIMPITTFSYDDFAKWDTYVLSMPVSRKQVIYAKYLLSLLMVLIGSALSLLFGFLSLAINDSPDFSPMNLLAVTGGVAALCITMVSIILPIIIKVGVERGRIAMFAVFFIPSIIVMLVSKNMPSWFANPDRLMDMLVLLAKLSPLLLLLLVIASISISVKFYKAKEF